MEKTLAWFFCYTKIVHELKSAMLRILYAISRLVTPHCNDDFNKIIEQGIPMADISYRAY